MDLVTLSVNGVKIPGQSLTFQTTEFGQSEKSITALLSQAYVTKIANVRCTKLEVDRRT